MHKSRKTGSSDRARRKMEKKKKRSARLHRELVALQRAPSRLDSPHGEWTVDLTAWEAELEKGMTDLEAGKLDEAERALRNLLADTPPVGQLQAQVTFGLGTVCAKKDDYEQAYVLLTRTVQLDGSRCEYWHNLAMTCVHRQRPYEAERAWSNCLQCDNAFEEVAQVARAALKAIDEQTRLRMAANPEVTHEALVRQERLFSEGVQAFERQDTAGAVARFEQSMAIDPMHFQSWGNLGAALLDMSRLDEGERALVRALELNPEYQFAQLNLQTLRRLRGSTTGGEHHDVTAQLSLPETRPQRNP